jgi:hypothetical protein
MVRDEPPMDCLSKDQEEQLKNRGPMFRARNEEHKWRIVYLILFPETELDAMPSPCKAADVPRLQVVLLTFCRLQP